MMDLSQVIISQYRATLAMLRQTVTRCPESVWNDSGDQARFWHIAYHALFYTHLYLQDSPQTFVPWVGHRQNYQFFGRLPWPPHTPVQIDEPYGKESVLDYLDFCEQQVQERVSQMKMDAESGFDWLPFSKLELQIYSIRHLQQHTGELMDRVGTRAGVEIDWVGMNHD